MTNATQPRERLGFLHLALLCLVLWLALALRLHELTADSLWFDEILTALRARDPLSWMLLSSPAVRERPLTYVITHFSLLLGQGDFFVRLPAVLEGVLAVAMMYRLGAALFGPWGGVVGALLLTVSPFHIRYSQEARFYALMVLLALASTYFLWRAVRGEHRGHWGAFVLCAMLGVLNQPIFALLLAGQVAFVALVGLRALAHRGRSVDAAVRWLSSGKLVWVALVLIALCLVGVVYARGLPTRVTGALSLPWIKRPPIVRITPGFLLYMAARFGAGRGFPLGVFLGAFVLGLLRSGQRSVSALGLLVSAMSVSLALLGTLRQAGRGVDFDYKYTIFLLPLYLVIVAGGVAALGEVVEWMVTRSGRSVRRAGPIVGLLAACALACLSLPSIERTYSAGRENWRGMGAFLRQNIRVGDAIVARRVIVDVAAWSASHVLAYYGPLEAEGVDFVLAESASDLETAYYEHERVWYVVAQRYVRPVRGGQDWLDSHPHVAFEFGRFEVYYLAQGRSQAQLEREAEGFR